MLDQAAQLRSILGHGTLDWEVLWAPAIGQRHYWARRLLLEDRRRGRETVLLDASLGELARAFGLAARIDLAHFMDGSATSDDLMRTLPVSGTLVPAVRALDDSLRGRRSLIDLQAALRRLPQVPDRAIVATGALPPATIAGWCDDNGSLSVAIDGQASTQMNAYALLKVMHAARPSLKIRILAESAQTAAAQQLAQTAAQFLGVELQVVQ